MYVSCVTAESVDTLIQRIIRRDFDDYKLRLRAYRFLGGHIIVLMSPRTRRPGRYQALFLVIFLFFIVSSVEYEVFFLSKQQNVFDLKEKKKV